MGLKIGKLSVSQLVLVTVYLLCTIVTTSVAANRHTPSWHPRRAKSRGRGPQGALQNRRFPGGAFPGGGNAKTSNKWMTEQEFLDQIAGKKKPAPDAEAPADESDTKAKVYRDPVEEPLKLIKKEKAEAEEPLTPSRWGIETDTWKDCDVCEHTLPSEPVWPPDDKWLDQFTSPVPRIPKQGKDCDQCTGATVRLERLKIGAKLKGRTRKVFLGASGAAVLYGHTTTGPVIVKIWCGIQGEYHQTADHKHPVPAVCKEINGGAKEKECPMKCMYGYGQCNLRFITALDKLYVAANLTAITPRSWTAPVVSNHPGPAIGGESFQAASRGKRISVMGQYYGVAPGVSIEAFTGGAVTPENGPVLRAIPPAQMVMAATADLLFSESDRHGQNVLMDDESNIQLIDNEGAFGPLNSMWLPGTQKHEIFRIGYAAVCCGNLPPGFCPGVPIGAAPESLLDYRCFAPGGKIGFDYPPGVMDFLERMAGQSPKAVKKRFGLTRLEHAEMLVERMEMMRTLGFEGTLEAVLAQQEWGDGIRYGSQFRYAIYPPCCNIDDLLCDFRVSIKNHSEYVLPANGKADGR